MLVFIIYQNINRIFVLCHSGIIYFYYGLVLLLQKLQIVDGG